MVPLLAGWMWPQSLGFTGTEEEWITSLGADTISSATVDSEGYLTMHMKGGADIKTPLQPIIDCIKYRDAISAEQNATSQAQNASNSASSATEQATNSSKSANNAKTVIVF